MTLNEILSQEIDTSNCDYDGRVYIGEQIYTDLVAFVVGQLTKTQTNDIDQVELATILANKKPFECIQPFTELFQEENLTQQPLDEAAIAFFLKVKVNCAERVFRLIAPFITMEDVEVIATHVVETARDYYSLKEQLLIDGLIYNETWLRNLISLAFTAEDMLHAAKTAFFERFYNCPRVRAAISGNTSSTYFNSNERFAQNNARSFCHENYEFILDRCNKGNNLLDHLDKLSLADACKYIRDFNLYKPGLWQKSDQFLQLFGYRMLKADYIEAEADMQYLQTELLASQDVDWIKLTLRSLNNKRWRLSEQYLACIENTLAYYLDNFDPALLTLEHFKEVRGKALIKRLLSLYTDEKTQNALSRNYSYSAKETPFKDDDWALVARYPLPFSKEYRGDLSQERMLWFWQLTEDVRVKANVLSTAYCDFCSKVYDDKDYQQKLGFFIKLTKEGASLSGLYDEICFSSYNQRSQKATVIVWPYIDKQFRKELIKEMYESNVYDSEYGQKLLGLVAEEDLSLAVFNRGYTTRYFILNHLNNQSFPQVIKIIEKLGKSVAAIPYLTQGLANVDIALIEEAGLYTYANKNIREAAQWSLFLSQKAGATEKIQNLLADKKAKLDVVSKGDFIDRLEADGVNIDSFDELKTADVEAYHSFAIKKLNATAEKRIARIFTPEVAAYFPDHKESFAYALSLAAQKSWNGVSRYTRQLIDYLPQGKRLELAILLIKEWSEGEANKGDSWVLNFLTYYGSDNAVADIQKLINAWCKKYKVRTQELIAALGAMDSALSLSACDEIYNKKKYSWTIRESAKNALLSAAKRRDIDLTELYDELIPTLGLNKQGLLLDVGASTYLVTVKPDLTFAVKNQQTGKVTKTLPKIKAEDDQDLYSLADVEFKTLKKNLRPVIKQLQARLSEALDCEQVWQSERWLSVFVEHPILSLVSQGIVWRYQGEDGASLTFRLSEDGSLIDFDDEVVTLGSGKIVIWHHTQSHQAEHDLWLAHFKDYELQGFVQQFSAVELNFPDFTAQNTSLTTYNNKQAEYGKFKRVMAKYNYDVNDGDGSWIASYMRSYNNAGWAVDVQLEDCRVYMQFDDEITFGDVEFYHHGEQKSLNDVPKPLIDSASKILDEIIG